MPFSIKSEGTKYSKCEGCVHAHIIEPAHNNARVTMCRLLNMAVGPVKECNQFLPHIHGPIPMHMVLAAWIMDHPKDDKKQVGFKPPPKQVGFAPSQVNGEDFLETDL